MHVQRHAVGGALVLAAYGLASAMGCSSSGNENVGMAEIAITQVPSDGSVGCIAITATGTFSVTQDLDVAPTMSTTFDLSGLPTGTVRFVGNAFAGPCSAVTPTSQPTWVSAPVLASLAPGQVAFVQLEMHRAGDATVGVDFGDEPTCRPNGDPCLGPMECCSQACVQGECADQGQNQCLPLGAACMTNAMCCSAVCSGGACANVACPPMEVQCGPVCTDLLSDPANCGACGLACPPGFACSTAMCVPAMPTCADGIRNGSETDIDCGGSCMPCGVGRVCNVNSDCVTGDCMGGICQSPMGSCADGALDGAETDVDCGGPNCAPCAPGRQCKVNADCTTSNCVFGVCKFTSCTDGIRDGAETDVDCGGPACASCAVGKQCTINSDCVTNACDVITKVCVANQCADHQKDGIETDVDCGGAVCAPCGTGRQCVVDFDCISNLCVANLCK